MARTNQRKPGTAWSWPCRRPAPTSAATSSKGGNAVDAAVATAFAMAVTYPAAGNIGGGGFMVIHPRGKASRSSSSTAKPPPPAATRTMFKKGDTWYTPPGASACPARSAAWPWPMPASASCPGKTWSCRPSSWPRRASSSTQPLAGRSTASLAGCAENSRSSPRVRQERRQGDGSAGDRLVQNDLAWTLRLIAEQGPDAFYKGPIADRSSPR